MAVKDRVLCALEQARGNRLSGGALADTLGVSRAAIHKAICALRAEGLQIDAVPGEGYRLNAEDDSLTAAGIQSLLQNHTLGRELVVSPSLSSTNTVIKEQYLSRPHGFTLVAEEQTGGRGRLGRTFVSPAETGVYLTILLHPTLPISQIQLCTIAAAVASAEAIEQTAGFHPQIKWVNDVLMQGRKLCGILTEATVEGESGAISSLLVGIGLNLRPNPQWPDDVKAVAGAISDFAPPPRRAVLAAAVIDRFAQAYHLLETGASHELLTRYRSRLCCVDQTITVIGPADRYEARCTGIDENGHLLIERPDGSCTALSSGEISIRLPKQPQR